MLTTINKQELLDIFELTPSAQNIMIAGKHGIGKSEIVKEFFEVRGKKVVTMFCSQAADPGDIIGLPKYDEETGKTIFALPWWFPTDNTPVVLFLDELNRARPEILQVVMDLALSRKIVGRSLPEGSQIISAVNCGDEYQLTDLDPALVSRFNIYKFEPSVAEWISYAVQRGIDERVVAFISQNSQYLDCGGMDGTEDSLMNKTPDRRAWFKVSDILKKNPEINTSLKKLLCGIVGGKAAVPFFEVLKKNTLVTAKVILENFESVSGLMNNYTIQEFAGINDTVCAYIETSLGDDFDASPLYTRNMYAKNLSKYTQYLEKKNREAMAHFINNYESQMYLNLNQLIASNPTLLENPINDFIVSIAVD